MFVHVDTSILANESNKISSYMIDLNHNFANLKNMLDDIHKIWNDSAYQNFAIKMNDFMSELDSFNSILDKYKEFIKGYISAQEKLENHYEGKTIVLK